MKNKDWALVISLGVLWGMSFVFVELLLAYLSPFMIVYLRVAIGALFLLAFVVIKRVPFEFTTRNIFNLSIMALLNNVIPFLLITVGQQTTTGGLASILNANTSFVTIMLAAFLLPHETLTLNRVIGALIGVAGVVVAIGYQSVFQIYDGTIGKYLILLATVSYAFAGIWGKWRLASMPPMIAATGMLTMSAVILSPYAFNWHFDEFALLDWRLIQYSVAFALLCSVMAYFLYFKILERTGAGNLLICTIIIPPSSILANSVLFSETVTVNEVAGLLIITIGLIVLDGRLIGKILK
ncbi:MAG: DMT family transporter [Proteobacteria bacterium]|nr:DMT family transporter [Pseudomonadota bacterium]